MSAHKARPIKVNLLPKDPFAQSSFGRLLNWALSIGRYIVVFTEMIVILTFLSRFTLDRQLTDLNETILKKQSLLESYSQIEEQVLAIQKKAKFITKLADQPQIIDAIDFIVSRTPSDIIFEDLSAKEDKIIISATAFTSNSLSDFVDSIKAEQYFADVSLDKISTNETDTGTTFILRTQFKQEPEE